MLIDQPRIAYIAFDTVPAPKGAAIHITAFVVALATTFNNIQLLTVSPTAYIRNSDEISPLVMQTMLPAIGDNLIARILYFRQLLKAWLQGKRFEVVQIRSIYEGLEIALNKQKYCDRLIFEVNGLPSIELKYRYPDVADDRELLHKLYSQEQICLMAADLIITPSGVTGEYLQRRGVPAAKIRVIRNGVDLNVFTTHTNNSCDLGIFPTLETAFGMIYFGTLSPWQGVNLAVEALALVNRDIPACLTVIGQGKDSQIKALKHLAQKLGVAEHLKILAPMAQTQLVKYIHASNAILAPLTPNDRNLVQGCCPLKILEGMSTGIPVIASDLPVVRELGEDGVHFLLVKPGSAKSIKDAVLQLRNQPELANRLAVHARQRIEKCYTWQGAGEALIAAYAELGIATSIKQEIF